MSVKSSLALENDIYHYPDIVYTLEPTIQHILRFLRILRWKKGYTHQSIILTLIWTFFWFHTLIVSFTIPIWIILILYHSFVDNQPLTQKETTVNAYEKLTVELKDIQFELCLILPSPDSKDQFRQWCKTSLFVLDQYKLFLCISFYTVWIGLLNLFGLDKIIWFLGCIILTWNSSLFKIIRYSYYRAAFILQKSTMEKKSTDNSKMTFLSSSNNDHFDRFYHFVVIEHQRWWLYKGWTSLLLPNERPEWSDEYLSKVPSISTFHLPPPITRITHNNNKRIKISWEWIDSTWEIDENHNVDKDGWEYGSWDWTLWSTKSSGLRVLTRRRHWVRNARRLVEEESTTTMLPIMMKKSNNFTCSSLSTSLSSSEEGDDSFMSSTPPPLPTLLYHHHTKSLSFTTSTVVEPFIFCSDDHQQWIANFGYAVK